MTELWGRGQRHDLEQARPGLDIEKVKVTEHARADLRRSAHVVLIGSPAGFPKPLISGREKRRFNPSSTDGRSHVLTVL